MSDFTDEMNSAEYFAAYDEDQADKKTKKPKQMFEALDWADITLPDAPNWLVEGVIETETFNVVFGEPGGGKSYLTLDMCLAIASGKPWFGNEIERRGVVYVAAEGLAGLKRRIAVWRHHHNTDVDANVAFGLIPAAPNMFQQSQMVMATIEHFQNLWKDAPIGMVVIDTLSRTFGTGDENGPEMASYVAACERIQREFKCSVLVIHHQPKNSTTKTPRGHGALWGAADTMLHVEKRESSFAAEVVKSKDTPGKQQFGFTLKPVDLEDHNGNTFNACYVQPNENGDVATKPRARLSKLDEMAFRSLMEVINRHGSNPPESVQAGCPLLQNSVTIELWREKFYTTRADDSYPAKKKSFQRAWQSLQALGRIKIVDPYVWII